MDRVKIQEIADEAGLSSTDLLDKAKELGFGVRTTNSTISMENAGILVDYAISRTLPKGFKKPINESKINLLLLKATETVEIKKPKTTSVKKRAEELLAEINKRDHVRLDLGFTRTSETKKTFNEIVNRITDQSYNYSNRNHGGKHGTTSSVFVEKYNNKSFYYIALFNYFDQEVYWVKINTNSPIQITKKYEFKKYDIYSKDEIYQKLVDGSIKSFVIRKDRLNRINDDFIEHQSLFVQVEVKYNKRIYLIIQFEICGMKSWVRIPLEGALSTRGSNILRTDEHGNSFSNTKYVTDDRYINYSIIFD